MSQKIFFPNLDGLRFLSFFSVFVFHMYFEIFEMYDPTGTNHPILKFFFQNGDLGVNFFFVLSGFLITFLLIKEKQQTNSINIGHFYMRRVLRIWPLFYMCVIFGIVLYPHIKAMMGEKVVGFDHKWFYFVFLNNFDFIKNHATPMTSVLWSVAVEEQFYLVWPILLLWLPIRKYPIAFVTIIIGTLVFRAFHYDDIRILQYHTFAVIGDMAMGGLLACFSIFSEEFKGIFVGFTKTQSLSLYGITLFLILFRKTIFSGPLLIFERFDFSILFGFIILEQNFSLSLFKMKNFKRLSKFGTYTYGLYCLHMIVVTVIVQVGFKLKVNFTNFICWWLTVIAFVGTLAVGYLSYRYFEQPFLKLKKKFEKLPYAIHRTV